MIPVRRIAVLALALACPVARAGALEDLEERWLVEASRLEDQHARYASAARRQEETLHALEAARAALDVGLADPQVAVSDLRRLEASLTRARDVAIEAAEDAARVRRDIYDQMDALDEVGSQVERLRSGELTADTGVAGLWRAEWGESGHFGIVKLETSGNFVLGTLRLTDGTSGSVKGTVAGDEMRLDVVNATKGFTGQVVLAVDASGDHAQGAWSRTEMGGPKRAAGTLSLSRMDAGEAEEAVRDMHER
jgi:hypothetical protein